MMSWRQWYAGLRAKNVDDVDLEEALDRAAYRIEPLLKQSRSWPKRYARSIAAALRQARVVAESIPGPVRLGPAEYARDPFVHALFASATDIPRILCGSPILREYAASAAPDTPVYALLSMRRMEKTVLGMALAGDRVRRDVQQRQVWFADHLLLGPAPNEAEARRNLLWTQFDRFLERLSVGVERLRAERDRLTLERDLALARLRGASAAQRAELRASLDDVLEQLRDANEPLQLDKLHEVFGTVLSHPEDCLYLETHTLSLDDMNVENPHDEQAKRLCFVDLLERYQAPRTMVLVHCGKMRAISHGERLDEAERWL